MELIDLIVKVGEAEDLKEYSLAFPTVDRTESLSGFEPQKSDIEGVDIEYVNQSGCGDYGHHGQIAIPFGDGRLCLVFGFNE